MHWDTEQGNCTLKPKRGDQSWLVSRHTGWHYIVSHYSFMIKYLALLTQGGRGCGRGQCHSRGNVTVWMVRWSVTVVGRSIAVCGWSSLNVEWGHIWKIPWRWLATQGHVTKLSINVFPLRIKNRLVMYMCVMCDTTIHKFKVGKVFIFRGFLCSPGLHLFDQKYSKNCNIAKYYYNLNNFFLF